MTIHEWLRRLWGTLRRHSDDEWQEELRFHLELAAEDARARSSTGNAYRDHRRTIAARRVEP